MLDILDFDSIGRHTFVGAALATNGFYQAASVSEGGRYALRRYPLCRAFGEKSDPQAR